MKRVAVGAVLIFTLAATSPRPGRDPAARPLRSLDWKLHEIVIMPVAELAHDELVREEAN